MVIDTKVSGTFAWNTVQEQILLYLGMFIQENTVMVSLMERVNILGSKDRSTPVILKKEWSTETESGKVRETRNVIYTKDSTLTTNGMGMEYSNGQVEMYTRVSTKMTKDTAKEKWYGLMEVCMTELGIKVFNMDGVEWFSLMEQKKKGYLLTIFSGMNCQSH